MDNLEVYSRQIPLKLNNQLHTYIVGCGGTGTWVAVFLAMSGVPHLTLIDPDKLELSNLNRLPYTQDMVGKLKVECLKRLIIALRPSGSIRTLAAALNKDSLVFLAGADLVIDCTDLISTQKLLYSYCKDVRVRYIRCGYDGIHITVSSTVPDWVQGNENEEERGYTITPSWVCPAAIAGALAVVSALYRTIEVAKEVYDI